MTDSNPPHLSDPDWPLVERAAEGDARAFEQLVLAYEQRIFRTILRITKVREDAEDQTQETFIRAYRGIRHFQGNSRFKTWLTQIAINQALMCLRKRHRDIVTFVHSYADDSDDFLLDGLPATGLSPEQQWAREQLAALLERKINRLPKSLRSAFVLRYVHEHTSSETARMLGISPDAVKSRALRARRSLIKTLR